MRGTGFLARSKHYSIWRYHGRWSEDIAQARLLRPEAAAELDALIAKMAVKCTARTKGKSRSGSRIRPGITPSV